MTTTTRRGRPPLAWLTAAELANLPAGTAVAVETYGRHTARTIGRLVGHTDNSLDLATPSGPVTFRSSRIRRARVLPGLYAAGDPVVLRDTPAELWRGGVVRTQGTDVLVEQIDGTFAWHHEDDLEPAEARDQPAPALPRGPVPVRAS